MVECGNLRDCFVVSLLAMTQLVSHWLESSVRDSNDSNILGGHMTAFLFFKVINFTLADIKEPLAKYPV